MPASPLTWLDPSPAPDAAVLAQALDLHPLAAAALTRRGVSTPAAAQAFLDPDAAPISPPEDLPDLPLAVSLLQHALAQAQRILVWGDFDVDGQTATALLVGVLRALGGDVDYHLPVRGAEGHGVALAVLQRYLAPPDPAQPPVALLLTCDTGITAHEALAYAVARGVTVIVTDHHTLAPTLPPAAAIVTPRRLPAGHAMSGLPGVGVAYKLMEALCAAAGQPELAQAQLDLTALGIVADVATIGGETRRLLQLGLRQLRQPPGGRLRPGLHVLCELAELSIETLDEMAIGFSLAPRLNALGRLADANPAVELLTTGDEGAARLIALQIETLNARRQLLTSQILRSALAQIEREPALAAGAALTLWHADWEPGVIGIVAGRLAELYARPVALAAAPAAGLAHGSIRAGPSPADVTVALVQVNQLDDGQSLLAGFGGHAAAAGFSLPSADLPRFARRFAQAIAQFAAQLAAQAAPDPAGSEPVPGGLRIDAYISLSEINHTLAGALMRLAPFGMGNPAPVLAAKNVRLRARANLGRQNEHLALTVEDDRGATARVLWWGGVDAAALPGGPGEALAAERFDLAFTLRLRFYNGENALALELVGARPAADAGPAAPPPRQVLDLRSAAKPAGDKPALAAGEADFRPLPALLAWLADYLAAPSLPGAADVPPYLIWAEGDALERLGRVAWPGAGEGQMQKLSPLRPRFSLEHCRALVIWSAPPSRLALLQALQAADPALVLLVGLPPADDTPPAYLKRLAGLVKGAITAQGGLLSLEQLAAASAQRRRAVQRGLDWLSAAGHITVHKAAAGPSVPAAALNLSSDTLRLPAGELPTWYHVTAPGVPDADAAQAAFEALRSLLDESRAYRAYWSRLPVDKRLL